MASTKPTNKPEWATNDVTLPVGGVDNKNRPEEALRETGWDQDQVPAADELNWQLNNIYEWIDYIDKFLSDPSTGEETLDGDYLITGSLEVDGETTLDGALEVNDTSEFNDDVTINANLTVNGTVSSELQVEDNMVVLNQGETGAGVTLGTSGIEIDRGTEDNAQFAWNETDDEFQASYDGGSSFHSVGFTTGDVKQSMKTSPDRGWVLCDDGTIGNASSGATNRANADTEALFTLLWNTFNNTTCPVSGGRGASAAADFAANKTIRLLNMCGRALGVAGQGLFGLTNRVHGQSLGSETHTLTEAEMPAHTHDITCGGQETESGEVGVGGASNQETNSTQSTGGGAPHNNMQPTIFINTMIKL